MDSLKHWFKDNYDDYLENLIQLMRIRSIYSSKELSYGQGVEDGLNFFKDLGIRMGLEVVKTPDYVYIDLNKKTKRFDVVSHVDVVDVDDTWLHPPFAAIIENNILYGRGAQDMKPQALLSIYVLKYMKELGIEFPNNIRVVIGSDEERSMNDIKQYISDVGLPEFAFTPDGKFPVCIGEKGVFTFALEKKVDTQINYMKTFQYSNIIPDAVEVFPSISTSTPKVEYILGKAAHSSRPELGDNALVKSLGKVQETWARTLYDYFRDYNGYGFPKLFSSKDEISSSVNLSQIDLAEGRLKVVVDIRFGKEYSQEYLTKIISAYLQDFKMTPLYYDPFTYTSVNNPYVQDLIQSYETVVKDSSTPYISGGVTYAKVFDGKCVAFGPRYKKDGMEDKAHQVDEYLHLDLLPTLFEIYAQAMMKWGNA